MRLVREMAASLRSSLPAISSGSAPLATTPFFQPRRLLRIVSSMLTTTAGNPASLS